MAKQTETVQPREGLSPSRCGDVRVSILNHQVNCDMMCRPMYMVLLLASEDWRPLGSESVALPIPVFSRSYSSRSWHTNHADFFVLIADHVTSSSCYVERSPANTVMMVVLGGTEMKVGNPTGASRFD